MSVIQLSPCVLIEDWAGFVDWCARTFDMPVSVKYDDQGWGRLAGTSEGVIVISTFDAMTGAVELAFTRGDNHRGA